MIPRRSKDSSGFGISVNWVWIYEYWCSIKCH